MRTVTAPALALALVSTATATGTARAQAHDVRGTISPSGMDFIADQMPSYVPSHLAPPEMTMDLFSCPGGRVVSLTQRDTDVDIHVDDVAISMPGGVLRVEIQFDVFASGEAYILYPYACFGSATCGDALTIIDGRAGIDFAPAMGADGRPTVTVAAVELMVDENDIDLELSGCAIDDVVNWVIDVAKDWLLGYLLDQVEGIAQSQLEPMLQDMIGNFLQFDGTLAVAEFDFQVTQMTVAASGLTVGGEADMFSMYPPDTCVGEDTGDPAPHIGATPDTASGSPSHVGIALNLGLVDDMLYHVWRDGLMCLTPEHLAAMGIELDLEDTAALLPGFPLGAELDIEMRLAEPPRVQGRPGGGAMLDLIVEGVEIDIVGRAPDGATTELHARAGAQASATVDVDPTINALSLRIDAVALTSLEINEDYIAETGMDPAQLIAVAETLLIPGLVEELGQRPLTGPIFGLGEYYLILRDVTTTPAHVIAKIDLFRKPAVDVGAPQTRIASAPAQVVRPVDAQVLVTGTDDLIPTELLRYRVSVDGVARAPTHVTRIEVGESAVSKTYRVEVAAMDLHDNTDPSPEVVDVVVDGVRPKLTLLTDRMVHLANTETHVGLEWTATDDLTPADELVPVLSLYRIVDPDDLLTAVPVGELELEAGRTSADVPVDAGERYRVVVTVYDEAGNATYTSAIVDVAGTPGGCGCAASGDADAALPLVVAGFLLVVRRRRRAC